MTKCRFFFFLLTTFCSTIALGQINTKINSQTNAKADSLIFEVPDFNYCGSIDSFMVKKIKQGYSLMKKENSMLIFTGKNKEKNYIYEFSGTTIKSISIVVDIDMIKDVGIFINKLGFEFKDFDTNKGPTFTYYSKNLHQLCTFYYEFTKSLSLLMFNSTK